MSTGMQKIEWARQYMPVLEAIRERFSKEHPLRGTRIGMALHVEAKTANLVAALVSGGAEVFITGCNPLSTQDDVASALNSMDGVECYAKRGASVDEYYAAIDRVLDAEPDVTVDDGMDLIHRIHTKRTELIPKVIGGCEETTTGVHRLRAMARDQQLLFPVIAVNDTPMKRFFDNVHGTGESALTAIMATTNVLMAGKCVVVAGYGYCGRGLARKLHGLGARVIVTEIDPRRALEAHMDGFLVMPMDEAASLGDIFVTVTASIDVVTKQHFERMKDGAVICNAGHFNREIDLDTLESMAVQKTETRCSVTRYVLPDGKSLHVLANAALVNIAAGDGHPIEIMDMSFSLQALGAEYLAKNRGLPARVYIVPDDLDQEVASLKLASFGAAIDRETEAQRRYRLEDVVI